jgi:hypothetical protein
MMSEATNCLDRSFSFVHIAKAITNPGTMMNRYHGEMALLYQPASGERLQTMLPDETVDSVLSMKVNVPLLIGFDWEGSVLLNMPVRVMEETCPLAEGFIATKISLPRLMPVPRKSESTQPYTTRIEPATIERDASSSAPLRMMYPGRICHRTRLYLSTWAMD